MTFEEIAIKEAEKMLKYGATDKEKVLAKVAIAAINKQIPKKPNIKNYEPTCPICGCKLVSGWRCYRNACGQAIDWSDEE